ncbi:hypothetical protein [Actinomyces ruminicola]|uniref:Tat (Twin-arginine translocation) pathway signal sequence n=1 Tax=Actinomyces ruminicola TaxID=332524 RepID=A0A1G9X756_9ACTO|nr:hypothetical protein [Actinomyces ruminicola]SDM92165.1 hypothetical protein SAMN04487766_1096 [Actinomyces ruminicola]
MPLSLSRRRFGLVVVGGTAMALGLHCTGPSAHAATSELIVGPAAVMNGKTVLRVATNSAGADLLTRTGAFKTASMGYTPGKIRLLSLSRGLGLRPLSEQPAVISTTTDASLNAAFAVFDGITGSGDVEVLFPGLGLIESVPVVASSQAPFSLA